MDADRIVGVDVFELNDAVRGDQENGGNRQLKVVFSRGGLQIDSILRESLERCIIHLIGNPEGLRCDHVAVREEKEFEAVLLNCLAHLGWEVRRNTDDLKSGAAELRFDVAQLNQLPVAVGSPASSIKHEQRGLSLDGSGEIEVRAIGVFEGDVRDFHAIQWGANVLG